jgi:hypothetical protein
MREERRPRITTAQIAEIRKRRADGLGLKEIAAEVGVSINTACRYGKLPAPRRCTSICLDVRRVQSGAADASGSGSGASFIRPPSLARLMAGR